MLKPLQLLFFTVNILTTALSVFSKMYLGIDFCDMQHYGNVTLRSSTAYPCFCGVEMSFG